VTNQTVEPGNTSDILYFMRVLLFVALLSMGYQLSRPQTASNKEQDLLLNDTARYLPSLPQNIYSHPLDIRLRGAI